MDGASDPTRRRGDAPVRRSLGEGGCVARLIDAPVDSTSIRPGRRGGTPPPACPT